MTDRYVCEVEIQVSLYQDGDLANSTYHHLPGECTQPELWLEQMTSDYPW